MKLFFMCCFLFNFWPLKSSMLVFVTLWICFIYRGNFEKNPLIISRVHPFYLCNVRLSDHLLQGIWRGAKRRFLLMFSPKSCNVFKDFSNPQTEQNPHRFFWTSCNTQRLLWDSKIGFLLNHKCQFTSSCHSRGKQPVPFKPGVNYLCLLNWYYACKKRKSECYGYELVGFF